LIFIGKADHLERQLRQMQKKLRQLRDVTSMTSYTLSLDPISSLYCPSHPCKGSSGAAALRSGAGSLAIRDVLKSEEACRFHLRTPHIAHLMAAIAVPCAA
jgi:quinol monooxygenase YgiN